MKIILTGATGFVGEGILLECLKDDRIWPCRHQCPGKRL